VSENRDDSLPEYFWAATRRLRELSRETLAPWDIAPSHARALRVLDGQGAMRLSDLSDRLHIAPRSTTEVIDALQARGYVVRRPDPGDRRATLVDLTADGAAAVQAIGSARRAETERFFGGLTRAERDQLTRILAKLTS
jgi:DNA-binding MarR family transcriptional regulator